MKIFQSFHDPKNKKYPHYYSAVLIIIIPTIFLITSGILKITPIEGTMIFFEGFFSLFMLIRHKEVGTSFISHLSKIKCFIKISN